MVIDAAGLERALLCDPGGFRLWAERYEKIDLKDGSTKPWKLNILQRRFGEAMAWCIANNRPMRFLSLKPRQKGSSTGWMGGVKWFSESQPNPKRTLIIGHEYSATDNMWAILNRFIENDGYAWDGPVKVTDKKITFPNRSIVQKETARDTRAGRSATCQVIIGTEVAHWAQFGVANADNVLSGMMNTMPHLPGTLAVLETTANGPSGVFFDYWTAPTTQFLHEAKAKDLRGWIKIFAGWHEFDDSKDELTDAQKEELMDNLTEDEKGIMARLGIGPEYIAFRRRTIATEFKGDANRFKQEFPENPEEAFTASSPSFFSHDGIGRLESIIGEMVPSGGVLDTSPTNRKIAIFSPVGIEQAMWLQYEPPIKGRRYVIGCDFATGVASDEKGTNRDHHGIIVLRQGYHDERGWHPPKVVMRNRWPCQWMPDIVAEQVYLAHRLYGGAFIVPERNCGTDIIRDLVDWGASVFEARDGVDINQEVKKARPSGRYGYLTTAESRRTMLAQLNQAVRDFPEWVGTGESRVLVNPTGGIVVDRRTLDEMRLFVQHKDGKYRALQGQHDDSVMALALAYALIDAATVYTPPGGQGGWIPGDGQRQKARPRPYGI